MSSNSSRNESNFVDCESSLPPSNISVSRRNSQQSSNSGNLLSPQNAANTQADSDTSKQQNQAPPRPFFGPQRPPSLMSPPQAPSFNYRSHDHQTSQTLAPSPVMGLDCHTSCQASGSMSYSSQGMHDQVATISGVNYREESVHQCASCSNNVDLRGYSVALIAPNGAIIPTANICPAGALMSAGSCTTSPPPPPAQLTAASVTDHLSAYDGSEGLTQMGHSLSCSFIANSSNSSGSDIYLNKSPYRQGSSYTSYRPPSSTPPDNYEFPTLPCQIISSPPEIDSERLREMADSLPPGFPAYLLPLREAVHIDESPLVASKPVVKPVAGHKNVDLDVMLPNGVFLTVPVFDDDILAEIKKKLWNKYREMLKDIEKENSQSTSAENLSSKEVPTFLDTQNTSKAGADYSDYVETNLPVKESNASGKKATKKSSFNVRSPSLNLGKLNPWVDKGEKVAKDEAKNEAKEEETLMRGFSMRQKVGNFVKSKFNKTGSVRVSSNDGYTRNAFLSSVGEAKTKTPKMSTSLSTPIDATIYSEVDFGATEKSKQTNAKNKNEEKGEKDSKPQNLKSANVKSSEAIETTASLVLADFETDLNSVKKEEVPVNSTLQSKFHSIVNDDSADYAFVGITSEAKNEEFYDDNLRLIDLDLFMPMLKLIEVVGNKQEKMVNSAISQIVGKPLSELDRNKTTEFSEYRLNMHLTMVASVKERKALSVDERIFYEFPPEMDDFETLQLSTKKIRKDIEAYRNNYDDADHDEHSSTEALLSSPSYGSLNEQAVYVNVNNLEQQHKSDYVNTNVPLTEAKQMMQNKENTLTKSESKQRTKEKPAESDPKAEYMEVIALKNSKRIVPKHCHTEYPLVLMGQQICTTESSKKTKKNKRKKTIKQEKIIETKKLAAKLEKNIPFPEKCSKSITLKPFNAKPNEAKNYDDHYEICFDHSSRSSSVSNFCTPESRKMEFHVWSSLVTLLHGGCHGRIKESGYANLIYLFDQICNADANSDGKSNGIFLGENGLKNGKPAKSSLFRNLFRKSRPLNVIDETVKNELTEQCDLSTKPEQSNVSDYANEPSTSKTLPKSSPSPNEERLESKTNKDDSESQSNNKEVPEIDSEIRRKFEVHPHLLPQMYSVKIYPEMFPRDLIDKVLRQYITWLRTWFQENISLASSNTEGSSSLFSSGNDSNNDNGNSGSSSGLSFSKTLTKLLNPKSSTSTPSFPPVDPLVEMSIDEIQETTAYVEMFIGTSSSFGDSRKEAKQQQSSKPTNQNQQVESTNKMTKLFEQTQSFGKLAAALSRSSSLNLTGKSMKMKSTVAQLRAMFAKLDEDVTNFSGDRYLLKICGYEQYIVGECSLTSFEYVRNCMSKNKPPQLMLISKIAIIQKIPNYVFNCPSFIRRITLNDPQYQYLSSSLDNLTEDNFAKHALQALIEGRTSVQQNFDDTEISLGGPPLGIKRTILKWNNSKSQIKGQRGSAKKKSKQVTKKLPLYEPFDMPSESNYAVICHEQTAKLSKEEEEINSHAAENAAAYVPLNYPPIDSKKKKFYFSDVNDDMSFERWEELSIEKSKLSSIWTFQSPFRVKVILAQYVNVKDVEKIYVAACVYHGSEQLCKVQTTRKTSPQNPRWDEMIEFPDLLMQDVPLSSRLALSLCAITNKHKANEEYATCWVNLQLFDHRRCMITGKFNMSMWSMPKGLEGILNPHGASGSNPHRLTSSRILVEFDSFAKPIVYPPKSAIVHFAKDVNQKEKLFKDEVKNCLRENEVGEDKKFDFNLVLSRVESKLRPHERTEYYPFFERCSNTQLYANVPHEWKADMLEKAATRLDPFGQLSEQEKDFFWRERYAIKNQVPDALPKVLESCKWNFREEVCQMYAILEKWPTVSVDTAITLLNARYLDTLVRQFAVRSLDRGLTDGLLENYLIQMVQLLKNEPYLDNALARFLLRRALLSRRFGHFFFWTLKSQLDDPSCSHRWLVMLEMYLRGLSPTALKITLAQVSALDEIERIGNTTAQETDQKDAIKKLLMRPDIQAKVNKLYNPLNIGIPMEALLADRLRVMDSAKKPMWLEWSNPDPFASYNNLEISAVIFKVGDDLRQDMISLEVIRIMDIIWRKEGIDLKMVPYRCISTGTNIGLIEVVKNAKTVMGIQRVGGRMAALQVDNRKLHKWIKEHNPYSYENAVSNFTRSCAGYCVATFVLGIGDRNPDNIMINESGQIFHIDFGHFLGHFKKKLGINRERVPFVLTYDFLSVITRGAENPLETKEFQDFQQLCYDAYLALHDNSHLLVSLFVMMLGIGIPELQALDDVQYLRRTLQVEAATREEARLYFEKQLDEAHGGAWSTKLDWFFHSVKHA